jgi:hypothetical protein
MSVNTAKMMAYYDYLLSQYSITPDELLGGKIVTPQDFLRLLLKPLLLPDYNTTLQQVSSIESIRARCWSSVLCRGGAGANASLEDQLAKASRSNPSKHNAVINIKLKDIVDNEITELPTIAPIAGKQTDLPIMRTEMMEREFAFIHELAATALATLIKESPRGKSENQTESLPDISSTNAVRAIHKGEQVAKFKHTTGNPTNTKPPK